MITNDLMVVTMGIAFYLIPLLLIVATLWFLWRRRSLTQYRDDDDKKRLWTVIRDPIGVACVLFVGGFVMVSFLTGRLSIDDYVSVPIGAADVMWRSLTEWDEPLSSESIALRGGVLIAIVSVIIVATTLSSYFRSRLRHLSGRAVGSARDSN